MLIIDKTFRKYVPSIALWAYGCRICMHKHIVCDTIEGFMLFLTFTLPFSRHMCISIGHIFNRKHIYMYYFISFLNFFTCVCVFRSMCAWISILFFTCMCVYSGVCIHRYTYGSQKAPWSAVLQGLCTVLFKKVSY